MTQSCSEWTTDHRSPFPTLARSQSQKFGMTTAGLPSLLHLLGLLRGRWLEHSHSNPGGGRMPGGRCCWTDRPFNSTHLLPSHCRFLSLSPVVRPWDIFCARSWEPRKAADFFPTWPSFGLVDGRGSFSVYNEWDMEDRLWWEWEGLEPHQAPPLKAHHSKQTQAHRL